MNRFLLALGLFGLVSASGCYSSVDATVEVEPKETSNGPMVPHPEFANWSQFPEDTTVVRRDQLASETGDVFQVTTLKLTSKSDEQVIVDSQTTIDRGGKQEVGESTTFEYPAKFQLPAGMDISQFDAPSIKAKLTKTERIEVAGKEYEVEVFEYTDSSEAGPLAVTVWRSPLIPGKQAKKQILDPDGGVLSSSMTTDIVVPNGAVVDNTDSDSANGQ